MFAESRAHEPFDLFKYLTTTLECKITPIIILRHDLGSPDVVFVVTC